MKGSRADPFDKKARAERNRAMREIRAAQQKIKRAKKALDAVNAELEEAADALMGVPS